MFITFGFLNVDSSNSCALVQNSEHLNIIYCMIFIHTFTHKYALTLRVSKLGLGVAVGVLVPALLHLRDEDGVGRTEGGQIPGKGTAGAPVTSPSVGIRRRTAEAGGAVGRSGAGASESLESFFLWSKKCIRLYTIIDYLPMVIK